MHHSALHLSVRRHEPPDMFTEWYIVSTPIPILNPQQPRDKRPATTKSHRSFPESGAVKFVIAIRVRLSSVFIEVGVIAYYPSRVQHISATVTTYNISSHQIWSGVIFGRIGASQIYPWEYWSVPTYGGRMRDVWFVCSASRMRDWSIARFCSKSSTSFQGD